VGKVVLAFLFFIAASVLAIQEARPRRTPPPHPHVELAAPAPAPLAPPSRAISDPIPPWVRYAPPLVAPDEDDRDSADDIIDVEDRCPDEPTDNDDGCPEPDR
jgi:hypothetical protein